MAMTNDTSVREAFSALGGRGRGRRYTPELRARAVLYLRARRNEGATAKEVATELAMCSETLLVWERAARQSTFKPVAMKEEVPPKLVVHGPRGLRVEGLDVATLARLLTALR